MLPAGRHLAGWLLLTLLTLVPAQGQRVGVVLSGGGARGLYHVGILKALEENDIPIDYISGASMGSIVGGLYAAGYSPDEMIRFFITDSTEKWLSYKNNELESQYYFKRFEPTPEMISIKIDPTSGTSQTVQLPTNLISPNKLDMAFLSMLAPASAAAGGNFDRLMVPFRCNASDIYNKKVVVFRKGSLPFAIRASMTIPMVFKPLHKDSLLLFDGGLYNNYPWQPLMEDFAPEVLIGGICAANFENPSVDNPLDQITVMTTMRTDYSLPRPTDIQIERNLKEVSALDYSRAGYLINCGYEDAMSQMERIKAQVSRRVSGREIEAKRAAFKARLRPLLFEQITITGLDERQTDYVMRQLGLHANQVFDLDYFKRKYMQVLAGGIFTGEFPELEYNPATGYFRMKLSMHTQGSLKFSLGGNISSTSLNQAYVAASYRRVERGVSTYTLSGFLGTFYNSIQVGGRHDLYTQFPFYFDYAYAYERYDYNEGNMKNYYRNKEFRYIGREDNYFTGSMALPTFENAALRGRVSLGSAYDSYFGTTYTTQDVADHTKFEYLSAGIELQSKSLNYRLYPYVGKNELLSFRYITGLESYRPGSTSTLAPFSRQNRHWFETIYLREENLPVSKWLTLGYSFEGVLSNQPDFANPLASALWMPAYQPIPIMATLFMPEYRSRSFVGAGAIPTFLFLPNFYLKSYTYAFLPEQIVYDHGWQGDLWERTCRYTEFVFGGSLVYQTVIGPASITVNKYTTGPKNWQVVFNFGYTLFSARK